MSGTITDSPVTLPAWSVDSLFPSLDSPEFASEKEAFFNRLVALTEAFDSLGVGTGGGVPGTLDVEACLTGLNAALAQARLLRGYVSAFVSVDTTDALAQAKQSELADPLTRLSKLQTRFAIWTKEMDLGQLTSESATCADHSYPLESMKVLADKALSWPEEALAADLYDSTQGAWARLHGTYTSQIAVDGPTGRVAMTAARNLAYHSDAEVRAGAYRAELDAWKANAVPIAASLNSIKAQTSLLSRKRGWPSLLDESLFAARIDRTILGALTSAIDDALPTFRRYFRAKAKVLGHQAGLPWYDLFAPVGEQPVWHYEDACAFVEREFATFSARMASLANRAFQEDWVDAAPRHGKVGGAFCMGLRTDESRILMNYQPSFGSVATLAHELGHAYHNLCLAERSELQRQTPMTLAETASIFCETIVKKSVLSNSSASERLGLLDACLQGVSQTVVDVYSRLIFESEVVDRRASRELSIGELCDAMTRAQDTTYGDGLASDAKHPYMWAVKPHYYSQRPFYNFPYIFGLLFSLGLYSAYRQEPEGFQERYDRLLSQTGMDSAANLALEFGIDITSKPFWAQSLTVIEEDIEEFVRLVG